MGSGGFDRRHCTALTGWNLAAPRGLSPAEFLLAFFILPFH